MKTLSPDISFEYYKAHTKKFKGKTFYMCEHYRLRFSNENVSVDTYCLFCKQLRKVTHNE